MLNRAGLKILSSLPADVICLAVFLFSRYDFTKYCAMNYEKLAKQWEAHKNESLLPLSEKIDGPLTEWIYPFLPKRVDILATAGLLEYGPFVTLGGQQVATIRLQKRYLQTPRQIKRVAREAQESEERMTLNGS